MSTLYSGRLLRHARGEGRGCSARPRAMGKGGRREEARTRGKRRLCEKLRKRNAGKGGEMCAVALRIPGHAICAGRPARGALPRHFHQWEPGTKHEILCRFRDKKRNFVPGSRHKLHVPGFVTRVPSISNKRISINSQTGNVAAMLIAHLLSEFTHLLPLIITGLQGQDTPLSLFLCWIQGRGMQRGGAR